MKVTTISHRVAMLPAVLLAAGSLFLCTQATHAAAIYLETFPGNSSANAAMSTIGWTAYKGASATNITSTTGGSQYVAIANLAGNPGPAIGFLAIVNSGSPQPAAESYATFQTGLSLANPTTISWNMNGNGPASPLRLLVQVSGSWYATDSTFIPTSFTSGANFTNAPAQDVYRSFNFTTDKSAWRSFTFSQGVGMSVGNTTISSDLASSTITGIGFYADLSSGSVLRVDQLQVVPEPGSAALLLGAGAMFVLLRVRRRTA
ncbi:PEP-CTERM protein-sorting domain-containing protein [Terrimicrobium sacchariphilum]|uniref:PEP-CTERM protein-sorting domain-containing protein n=1 Tax=Terrimicrobium sacchariphilum TaxID=690879 RepID=A0A146GD24_TERSA|nr:PEP-CTERM sorting domain-containing protein [Terrimicrobium sacchariphilum]GAT35251.1 PEP-CTERM protein-sorting domain-containing protein [Terrimicrobium sacchariphilum]